MKRVLHWTWRTIVFAAGVWYFVWRMMLLSGSIHKVGEPCSGKLECRDGPCLIHARDAKGAMVAGPGYCSHGCKTDEQCPAGLRCQDRPPEISRAAGDHLPYVTVPARLCIKAP